MNVNPEEVSRASQTIGQAASPITSCLDALESVTIEAPGFSTAPAAVAAAHQWATELHGFSSGFSGFASEVQAAARTYVVQEQVLRGRMRPE